LEVKTGTRLIALILAHALTAVCLADEPPGIEHQPIPCTVPDAPFTVCANVSDDEEVRKVRVFFRAERAKYFNMSEMVFGGLNYCATLPAPRKGKAHTIEYYVQATDSALHFESSPVYQILVQDAGVCAFPPIEKDAERVASIVVYATIKKQGKKLHKAFVREGVTFVPVSK
jgi:hypothetical protein